jgi:hypothetical protein
MDHLVSYRFEPSRGVYDVRMSGDAHPDHTAPDAPTSLRALFDNSVALYDCGCWAGMRDARSNRRDRRALDCHRRLSAGSAHTAISRAFSRGYVAGFAAVASGTIA